MKADIFEVLQGEILDGTLMPGDRIKEADLANRFGLSRTPVREALRRLEARGLLAHEPHRGMVVAQLEPAAVAELYAMREILDGAAAELAARHATPVEIDAMRGQIARDRGIVEDPVKLAAANRAFHAAILRAAHNRFLMTASDALAESLALLGPTTLSIPGRGAQSIDEHTAIVDAIAAGDSVTAGVAARAHITASFRARLQQIDATIIAEAAARDPG